MDNQTMESSAELDTIALRHGFSRLAVEAARDALRRGGGSAAQFSHHELGGSVQWMRGGMIQIGDMFNADLKARVAGLLEELSGSPAVQQPAFSDSDATEEQNDWWPEGLGTPGSVGGQNDDRYAFFPDARRLVVQSHGETAIYDTGDRQITGAAQGQGTGEASRLRFSTHGGGAVEVGDLREVSPDA